MKVDERLVTELSSVMKLSFSEEETKELVAEVNDTLEMLATLSEVDTTGVVGTFHGISGKAPFRNDEPVQDKEEVATLLKQARASKGSLIEVPAILDDGEGGA